MSQIQSRLDILISVTDQNMAALTRPQAALKQLLNAQSDLDRARGRSREALAALRRLEIEFQQSIANTARRTLELLRVQRQQVRTENERRDRIRQAIVQAAQLDIQTGNLTRAEQRLNRALSLTNRTSAEGFAIRQRLLSLDRLRHQADQRATQSAVQRALAEARVARAAGNAAREIQILTNATKIANITDQQRFQILTALQGAQARSTREAERAARAAARAAREGNLFVRTFEGFVQGFNTFTRILAAGVLIGFTARTIFRTINRFIIDPLLTVINSTLEATERFRQLEASLTGVVGSMRGVRSLMRDIGEAAQGLPISRLEAISGVRGLAFTPGVAGVVQTPGPQRAPEIQNLLRILTGLATIDPDQGIEGARFAVREALSGEFRSLRFRFELSPNVIAATVGASLEDLKADPRLTITALRSFVDTFVGEEAIAEFNKLLSVQGRRLRDELTGFFAQVGNQGFFDRVSGITGRLANLVGDAASGSDINSLRAAALINESLDNLLNAGFVALEDSIQNLTGVEVDLSNDLEKLDLGELALAAANLINSLAALAGIALEMLPYLANIAKRVLPVDFGPLNVEDIEKRLSLVESHLDARAVAIAANAQRASSDVVFDPFTGEMRPRGAARGPQTSVAQAVGEAMDRFMVTDTVARAHEEPTLAVRLLGRLAPVFGRLRGTPDTAENLAVAGMSTDALNEQRRRLRRRLRFLRQLEGLPEEGDPADLQEQLIRGRAAEVTKALGIFSGEFDQALRTLPDRSKVNDFTGQISFLAREVEKAFNPEDPASLTARIGRATADTRLLIRELNETALDADLSEHVRNITAAAGAGGPLPAFSVAALAEGAVEGRVPTSVIQRMDAIIKELTAVRVVQQGVSDQIADRLVGIIGGSEGFTRQLPPRFRVGQSLDILSTIAGQDFRGQLGVQGLPDRSAFAASIDQALATAGIDRDVLMDPQLIGTISSLIDDLGDTIGNYTGQATQGARASIELASAFQEQFQLIADTTPDANLRERALIAVDVLQEIIDKAEYAADVVKQVFAEMSTQISQTLGEGLTDTLIATFDGATDDILASLENMLRSIQRIVLRSILELTVIRGIINPILNTGFGLTGTPGALPTTGIFSELGNIFSAGRVRAFATGGLIGGPTVFPLAGGQVGMAGERGPEAIFPLTRTRDGDLGLRSDGRGGGGTTVVQNITIRANDVDSFRRSKRQVAAALRQGVGG